MERRSFGKERLDQFTLDIEFLLISVVQGVALSALATAAFNPISNLSLEYWLYIVSAFLIIIIFWSQAIIHALSFVNWPLDLLHNFLYFTFSFIEVITFAEMTSPLRWFAFNTVLFFVALILYIVDLRIIKSREKDFTTEAGKKLYTHIYGEQMRELKSLVPLGLAYNLIAFYLIQNNPQLFLDQHAHLILIGIQVIFEIGVLTVALISFKKRSRLISEAM